MAPGAPTTPRRRRFDPERRTRIAEATLQVVAERGLEGLTTRAVAQAADVPLGSVSYHFSSSEHLLEVALELSMTRNAESWREWSESLPPDPDLPEELTKRMVDAFGETGRERMIVQLELYLAAIRRPRLRATSAAWNKIVADTLARHTDRGTAELLSVALEGLSTESLVGGGPPTRERCLRILRRIADG